MSPALLLVAALQIAPSSELLDFSATWCGPCQQVKPTVERLRREGFPIREVDVDRQRDVAQRFGVKAMPTFVLIVEGQEVARVEGYQSEASLRAMLAKIPRPKLEPTTKTVEAEPEKKPFFTPPWGRKPKPPAEPPQFDDRAEIRPQSPDSVTPSRAVAPSAAQDPLQTVVRIRVKDERGTDFGSGTVIGSLNGKALVLTCWHIFREFGESAVVEVDLFPNGPDGPVATFPGRLIKGDEAADVAVVGVNGCGTLPVSPIAARSHLLNEGDHVFSVGCGEGKVPTKLQHTITRLNPYEGPETTECTGEPVVGRSGGGLFDTKGRVIGVCFAANRAEKKGVYVGLAEIQKLIESAGYAALIPAAQATQVAVREEKAATLGDGQTNLAQTKPLSIGSELSEAPETDELAAAEPPPAARAATGGLDIPAGMEATIILRPRNQLNAPSKVIVINNVSNRFRRYLTGELDPRPVETGLRVPVAVGQASGHRTARVALLSRVFNNRR
ncbi:MAG: thioredoxin domain-containing protein [Planctomycetota bacterium]|nr:trypsin-like peptidase domain-containing protein [Planctomycetaceae bacterium]MDQ3330823.1 thioredoxin domain-containing protein [Planctomycetota bacterium]